MTTPTLSNLILYEDEDIIVISKPAGLVSANSETVVQTTIQDMVLKYVEIKQASTSSSWEILIPDDFSEEYGSATEIFKQRSGIAHRLDKDTSGVMLIGKNPGSLVNLLSQFKNRKIKKQYLCLTHGKFSVPEGEISAAVIRDPVKRHQFAVRIEGRSAITMYKVQNYYPHLLKSDIQPRLLNKYQGFSLVDCWPKTGRTHQIRVHMAFIKHPLVGDQTYVGKKRAALDIKWCPRQFLHANSIVFYHPRTGEIMTLTAPLPDDLRQVLQKLEP